MKHFRFFFVALSLLVFSAITSAQVGDSTGVINENPFVQFSIADRTVYPGTAVHLDLKLSIAGGVPVTGFRLKAKNSIGFWQGGGDVGVVQFFELNETYLSYWDWTYLDYPANVDTDSTYRLVVFNNNGGAIYDDVVVGSIHVQVPNYPSTTFMLPTIEYSINDSIIGVIEYVWISTLDSGFVLFDITGDKIRGTNDYWEYAVRLAWGMEFSELETILTDLTGYAQRDSYNLWQAVQWDVNPQFIPDVLRSYSDSYYYKQKLETVPIVMYQTTDGVEVVTTNTDIHNALLQFELPAGATIERGNGLDGSISALRSVSSGKANLVFATAGTVDSGAPMVKIYGAQLDQIKVTGKMNEGRPISVSRTTGVGEDPTVQPNDFTLGQNYPNPFNPTTRISFTVPQAGKTILKVYDVLGKEVATLMNQEVEAGHHEVNFNASNLPSGIYFYEFRSGNFTEMKKMTLLK